VIIDCISDLHGHYPELEGGDLLIIVGDLTAQDHYGEYDEFFDWLEDQKYIKKILIAGNHDNRLEEVVNDHVSQEDVSYLCDSGTEFEYEEDNIEREMCGLHPSDEKKLKIWGSPWTMRFEGMNPHCMAFTVENKWDLERKWALIPKDIDILVTHSPPHGILDRTIRGDKVGCPYLYISVHEIKPKLHVFGHIHEAYGQDCEQWGLDGKSTRFVNASHVNELYKPVNKPIRIEL
jgi:Icc-related predicted phosphoesterase